MPVFIRGNIWQGNRSSHCWQHIMKTILLFIRNRHCQRFCQWHQTFCPITGANFQLNDSGTLSGNNSGTPILSGVLTDPDCLKIGKDRLAYCDFVGRALLLAIMMARTGLVGTIRDYLGPLWTTWNSSKIGRTTWEYLGLVTSHQENLVATV